MLNLSGLVFRHRRRLRQRQRGKLKMVTTLFTCCFKDVSSACFFCFQCLDDLVCFRRTFDEAVPGCRGQGRPSMDYCVLPPTMPPTSSPTDPVLSVAATMATTMVPTTAQTAAATEMIVALQTVGDGVFGMPLGLCQGDCDAVCICEWSLKFVRWCILMCPWFLSS